MEYLDKLNDKQREAVLHMGTPSLILAGAGTGKTTVLTSKIAYIIESALAQPYQILSVTFTNKAAKEMNVRLEKLLSLNDQNVNIRDISLGTFHSIAARLLRKYSEIVGLSSSFNIIDDSDQYKLIKRILENNNIEDENNISKLVAHYIRTWKDNNIAAHKMELLQSLNPTQELAAQIYKQYQKKLQEINSVDFGDLLLYNLSIFESSPEILQYLQKKFRFILVDEYQDTNKSQYFWLRLLSGGTKDICCVGDDDQSIYGWRGADISHILNFPQHFKDTKIIKLEQNYRSKKNILLAASSVISFNKSRHQKILWTEQQHEDKITITEYLTDKEESWNIAKEISKKTLSASSVAILVRSSAQTRVFEEAFIQYGVPYKLLGGLRFYERQEIKDILAYLRLTTNFKDNLAFERIINTPRRAVGKVALMQIHDFSVQANSSYFEALFKMLELKLFKGKAGDNLRIFVQKILKWQDIIFVLPLAQAVEEIMEESGYMDMWRNEKTEDARIKLENLRELIKAVSEFNTIGEFLENVTLASVTDGDYNEIPVLMMTLHAAKGLEFDTVYLPGWEEGLFPHQRSMDENGDVGVEEERRLAYVGITRAKNDLKISYALNRNLYGRSGFNSKASRFIKEIPEIIVDKIRAGYDIQQPERVYAKIDDSFLQSFKWWSSSETSASTVLTENTKSATDSFSKGDKVKHEIFGDGVILNHMDTQYEVFFYKMGKKVINKNFLKLTGLVK